jgi:hypothetical protein
VIGIAGTLIAVKWIDSSRPAATAGSGAPPPAPTPAPTSR